MLISKYETGRSTPSMENLGKIAKALDVTVDYLIFDNVPSDGRVEFKDVELMEKFKEAAEAYDVLGDEEKRRRYDQFGHAGVDPNMGGGAGGFLPSVSFQIMNSTTISTTIAITIAAGDACFCTVFPPFA